MKKLAILLFTILHALSGECSVRQNETLDIIFHFNGPTQYSPEEFQRTIMPLYNIYFTGKVFAYEGRVFYVREDYSEAKVLQLFDGKAPDSKTNILKEKSRLATSPSPYLALPWGIRQYERPKGGKQDVFFLSNTTNSALNQYASGIELYNAIHALIREGRTFKGVHIYVMPAEGDFKDANYESRTRPFLSQRSTGALTVEKTGRKKMETFFISLEDKINSGDSSCADFFGKVVDPLWAVKIENADVAKWYFQNPEFEKVHYIFKKGSIEFISADSSSLKCSFYTEFECYRPAKSKYEMSLVKVEVVFDRMNKIVSLKPLEVLGLVESETAENPKKMNVGNSGKSSGNTSTKGTGDLGSNAGSPPPPPVKVDGKFSGPGFTSEEPKYIGGIEQLFQDVYAEVTYPPRAIENGAQGVVYISFFVGWDGTVSECTVDKGIEGFPEMDEAALNAVKSLEFFRPSQFNGQSVKYRYRIPIKFTMK